MYLYGEQTQAVSFSALTFWGNLLLSIAFAIGMGYVGALYHAPLAPYTLVLWIAEFGMLFSVAILRKRHTMSYAMAYTFTGVSGLVTGVAIASNPVYMRVVGASAEETLGLFAILSLIAVLSGQVFMNMGRTLFAMLIALIVVDFVSMFMFHTPMDELVLSSASGLLFCGFVLYDIQRAFRKQHVETIPIMIVYVYLDVLNLFLSILNVNAFFSKR